MKKADIDAFNAKALVALELDVMRVRHHRSSAFIATRTWMRFMTLIFGAILVVIGSAFILGKISGPETEAGGGTDKLKLVLKSSSPGIFLVVAGGLLIWAPHTSKQQITTSDASSFIGKALLSPKSGPGPVITPEINIKLDEIRKKYGSKEE